MYWLPIYLLGAVIGNYYDKDFCEFKIKIPHFIFSIIIFSLLVLGAYESRYLFYVYRLLAPILLWVIFDWFAALPEPKWWIRCTLFYYGTHILVISSVAKIYKMIVKNNLIMQILSNVFVPLMCIAVLVCLAFLIKKFIPFLWKLMMGSRK